MRDYLDDAADFMSDWRTSFRWWWNGLWNRR